MRKLLVLGTVCLSGCASILSGTSQQVMVNTNPGGARCGIYKESERVATIDSTPGSATVQRTKHDIWLACVKPGYQAATYRNHSGIANTSFGNLIAGGLIGVAVDSATGADNRYETPVNVSMVPLQPGDRQMIDLPQRFDGTFPAVVVPVPAGPATSPVS